MNYQEMSDFEINAEVGALTGEAKNSEPMLNLVIRGNGRKFDPCNSWADAGPIIQENRISLFASDDEGKWMAQFINYKTVHMDKNPLRAAMIVFLMMKGGEL